MTYKDIKNAVDEGTPVAMVSAFYETKSGATIEEYHPTTTRSLVHEDVQLALNKGAKKVVIQTVDTQSGRITYYDVSRSAFKDCIV